MQKTRRQACAFCAAGYNVPTIRLPAKLYKWPGKHFGDNQIPICAYHARLRTDWLPADPEERATRLFEMETIAKEYFRKKGSN